MSTQCHYFTKDGCIALEDASGKHKSHKNITRQHPGNKVFMLIWLLLSSHCQSWRNRIQLYECLKNVELYISMKEAVVVFKWQNAV